MAKTSVLYLRLPASTKKLVSDFKKQTGLKTLNDAACLALLKALAPAKKTGSVSTLAFEFLGASARDLLRTDSQSLVLTQAADLLEARLVLRPNSDKERACAVNHAFRVKVLHKSGVRDLPLGPLAVGLLAKPFRLEPDLHYLWCYTDAPDWPEGLNATLTLTLSRP